MFGVGRRKPAASRLVPLQRAFALFAFALTMKTQLLRYLLAMNSSALQAGAHAARAFFALAGAHAIANDIPAINWPQFAAVFLLAFAMEILNYLDTHPVPLSPSAECKVRSAEQSGECAGAARIPNSALRTPHSEQPTN